ncbi:MAG: putative bifunctional diguanylate cyclase/phosphodiesterase [Candidatus Polarisedimenticolia bacterium]
MALYSPERDPYKPRRLAILGDLRRAIESDQLFLEFQPRIDLANGRLLGAEALVRWHHPVLGTLPPVEFIPLAEQTGLMRPLTRWVLGATLRQLRAWEEAGLIASVSANVSARNLHDPRFPEEVEGLLATWGTPPERLVLEITESAILQNERRSAESLKHLRSLGLELALDDFGTGYSSLTHLRRLPFSEIKIDQSFVKEIATRADDAAIVRATSHLGHSLGIRVAAEGVEDALSLDCLRSIGCDLAQGYYLGRPADAASLSSRLPRAASTGEAGAPAPSAVPHAPPLRAH